MKRNFWLFCSAFILVSFFTVFGILILGFLANPGYLELYDFKKDEGKWGGYNTGYLRWHGRETELEIWAMGNMKSGRHYYITVEDGDNFTVRVQKFTGWVEFYYDGEKRATLRRSGELDDC